MRSKTAITPQKRGLEIPSQPHQDLLQRAELSQGPPKATEVVVLQPRHLLSKQPAEKVRAFRQSFVCPPDASSLNLGGGRGPRALARQFALFIPVPLQLRHPKAPAFPPTAPRLPLRRPAVRRPTRSGRAPTTHLHKSSRIKPYPIHRDYPGASHYLFDENRTEAERWMTEALTSANSLALPKLERIARTHSLKIPG